MRLAGVLIVILHWPQFLSGAWAANLRVIR